jgi:ferredoxin-like protein FixX
MKTSVVIVCCASLAVAGLLVACTEPTKTGDSSSVDTGRFAAQYQGCFRCGTGDREAVRSMYIITDASTGIQYLAVQGCGTSQLVTEKSGKSTVTVER